jgi:hypothetical protein
MEGADLNEEEHAEWERKSSLFWNFYDKARNDQQTRSRKTKIKSMLRKARLSSKGE